MQGGGAAAGGGAAGLRQWAWSRAQPKASHEVLGLFDLWVRLGLFGFPFGCLSVWVLGLFGCLARPERVLVTLVCYHQGSGGVGGIKLCVRACEAESVWGRVCQREGVAGGGDGTAFGGNKCPCTYKHREDTPACDLR